MTGVRHGIVEMAESLHLTQTCEAEKELTGNGVVFFS